MPGFWYTSWFPMGMPLHVLNKQVDRGSNIGVLYVQTLVRVEKQRETGMAVDTQQSTQTFPLGPRRATQHREAAPPWDSGLPHRNGFFSIPDYWEYSNHEQPHPKHTEGWPELLKTQVQSQGGVTVRPWASYSTHPGLRFWAKVPSHGEL